MSECESIRPRLVAFLHGEVEQDQSIEAHIESCAECRAMMESHKKVAHLTSLPPDLEAHPDAWSAVEAQLALRPRSRLLALAPAVAAACIALVLVMHSAFWGSNRRRVATFARKVGPVRIKPFLTADWQETGEKQDIYEGDNIRTGAGGAARVELPGGAYLMLDGDTEVQFASTQDPQTRIVIVCGRMCASSMTNLCIEAASTTLEGTGCCFVEAGGGNSAVYVKSGEVRCLSNCGCTVVKSMQKMVLNTQKETDPRDIGDESVFEWVDNLFNRTAGETK